MVRRTNHMPYGTSARTAREARLYRGPSISPAPSNPYAVLDDASVLLALVARWEGGGAAPPQLASRAQNSGIAAGDPLEYGTDWSAAGNHLRQTTLAQQPTWETAGTPDGVGAAYFDGTAWWDTIATLSLELDTVVLAVWQPTTAASFGCVLEHGDVTGGADGLRCNSRVGPAAAVQDGRRGGAYSDAGTLAATPPTAYLSILYRHNISSAVREVLVDGVDVATPSGNPIADSALDAALRVGARVNGTISAIGYLRGLAVLSGSASAGVIDSTFAILEGS